MAIITLTTDFGVSSPYVAEMKGAILSIASDATIVDVTHAIAPQDIMQGALAVRQIAHAFPADSIHVAVVDPGVGTNRSILLVRNGDQFFIAPDNGLLTFVFGDEPEVRTLDRLAFWRGNVSTTFHGRDIMGPVAAHLANGRLPNELGAAFTEVPILLALVTPKIGDDQIRGQVIDVDSFGNLITNISQSHLHNLGGQLRVEYRQRLIEIESTYGNALPGEAISLIGSSGWLEIAVARGNARQDLAGEIGDMVTVLRG